MFYVKGALGDNTEIKIDITRQNTYGHCPVCNKEIEVNLEEVIQGQDELDLYNTQMLCESCSKSIVRKDG